MANILVFGASIAQGYYDKEGGWIDRLKKYFLEQEIIHKWEQSINVFNLAISGNTTSEILERLKLETKPRNYKSHKLIFLFEIGLNDSIIIKGKDKVSLKIFQKSLNEIIDFAKKYSKNIIFLGLTPVEEEKVSPMPWSPTESYSNKRIEEYDAIIRNVCKNYKVKYLDLFKYTNKQGFIKHLDDGVHPNSEGHRKIFEIVRDFLVKEKII